MQAWKPAKAALIWNPVAGWRPELRRKQVEDLARGLEEGGWAVEMAETNAASGAHDAALRGARAGCSLLVACGGDGTLNEMVNAIMELPAAQRPCLAVVPMGTANVYANALGCPAWPPAAVRWLLQAQPRPVALGRLKSANGIRHFLAVASVGIDAETVRRVRKDEKRFWGKLAYLFTALRVLKRYFPAPIKFEIKDKRSQADGLVLGLTMFYGGRMRLGELDASGSIALALHGAPGLLGWQALSLATVGLDRAPGVERLPAGPIHILTPGRPLELDGEPGGLTPARLEVVPAGIEFLGPIPEPVPLS